MGIPLLYPWANRLAGPRFEVAGLTADVSRADPPPKLDGNGLPIHGLLTAAPGWQVERHAESATGATLAAASGSRPATRSRPGSRSPTCSGSRPGCRGRC